MTIRYVLTITGAGSEQEALTFYCNQVSIDYGAKACRYMVSKGFKRTLLRVPAIREHIEFRFRDMHMMSPSEFIWMDGGVYVVYGLLPGVFGEDRTVPSGTVR